ncbi:MAG: arginine--tRNA ligase [Patescibacteria group bacterium]
MFLRELKKDIAKVLSFNDLNIFSYPPNSEMGDLCLPLFSFAKERGLKPNELADDFKEKIIKDKKTKEVIDEVKIIGPYLNIFINKGKLAEMVISDVLKHGDKYGFNNDGENKKVVYEYSNANTHKEIHIGHLRNIVFGEAIVNISRANGFDAHPVSFINDLGINTAKTVWAYKKGHSENIGLCYSWSVSEIDKNPEISEEISTIMTDIEKKRGENYDLWKKTKELSVKEFEEIYDILGIGFEKTYFESDFSDRSVEIVEDFLSRGIFKRSQGAIIADLEEYGLGVLPIVRSDGTSLYAAADLALNEAKNKDFPDLAKSFIIVDVRQSLHFKQLFKIFELAGYKNDFTHLSYDFVKLPEGMMSSRSGKVIVLKDLYNQVVDKISIETKKRHEDWADDKIDKNSKLLAVAILKFEMLKIAANKTIVFDIKEALKFEGFSALYILYSIARMKSLLRKSNGLDLDFKVDNLIEDIEKNIILEMAKYPDIVEKSSMDNDPSEIAKYLFDFTKMFNDYYQKVNILQAESEIKKARLSLIFSCVVLLENALALLGIKTLDEI